MSAPHSIPSRLSVADLAIRSGRAESETLAILQGLPIELLHPDGTVHKRKRSIALAALGLLPGFDANQKILEWNRRRSRRTSTVEDLAQQYGIDRERVVDALAGLPVKITADNGTIPAHFRHIAIAAIGMRPGIDARLLILREPRLRRLLPPAKDVKVDDVDRLSRRFGVSAESVQEVLGQAGYLSEWDSRRVRGGKMRRAIELLQGDTAGPIHNRTERIDKMDGSPKRSRDEDIYGTPDIGESKRRSADRQRSRLRKEWGRIGEGPLVVGKHAPHVFLSAQEVESIHYALVEDFSAGPDPIVPPGMRDENLLSSAVGRASTSLGGHPKYGTVSLAGAALFYGLIHDHPFHNGNKRTALVALLAFLDRNGHTLHTTRDEIFDFTISTARHGWREEAPWLRTWEAADYETWVIATWIQRHARKSAVAKHGLVAQRDLLRILDSYGVEITHRQSQVLLQRDGCRSNLPNAGRNRSASHNTYTVHRIRRELKLDESHGFDTASFFGHTPLTDTFIARYRSVLRRLANA